ncbi:hypothetical protein NEUTE1DRAFT_103541 [Neurospora tetrasperma FGSC 2508]|uniref:Kelch repeat protein n=1 Tax=Neurospora tetrasperma (strain FGSC 2508 / ATCC MYA-4615 / P0657) TaxID=510951 RepID=F8MW73_NEUT8|nr:uncharacterized protein NEUTE1DRAFT_103541 [Neurospora tetrasperma FGSC 2508]EGO54068.1 hypothetical protein NEUTE1DRAFT_103541 [Neurospora tetrasperma FGSC 2508]
MFISTEIKVTPKKGPVALSDQAIWNDPSGDAFHIFGGRAPYMINRDKITKDGIWKFTVDGTGGGTWTLERPSNPDVLNKLNLTDMAAFTATHDSSAGGVAFVIGGTTAITIDPDSNNTSPTMDPKYWHRTPIPGMVSYDMKSRTFSRTDTSAAMPMLTGGRAHFVPQFGSNGLMLVLGGIIAGDVRDFNNITFYDPKTGQWGWQNTVGYAPTDRFDFCMVGVASPAGTYELFIYGGENEAPRARYAFYDDIYILSLLGFVWLKIDAHSVEPCNNQDCVVVGKRQMLVVGGLGKNWSTWDEDPFPQGLGIFDLTDLVWSKDGNYDADAEDYRTPKFVEEWYQDKNLSALSWSSDEVKRMFLKNPVSFTATTSGSAPTSIATSAPGPDSGQQSSVGKAGSIAGGVVGGAVILCILSGLAYWLWQKRSKPSPSDEELKPGQSNGNALKHSPSLEPKRKLPTEGLATEMYTPPDELACGGGINERWELDASSPPRELDTSHGACELGVESSEVTR